MLRKGLGSRFRACGNIRVPAWMLDSQVALDTSLDYGVIIVRVRMLSSSQVSLW